VPKICTLAVVGDTATPITGTELTVIVASSDLLPSVTEVAVIVTAVGEGAEAGAV
jgi:hypothetical protein